MGQDNLDNSESEESSSSALSIVANFNANFVAKVRGVPKYIMEMDEADLEDKFKPTAIDLLIRKNIHSLSKESERTGIGNIATGQICKDICTRQNFHVLLAHKSYEYRLAWWLTPMSSNAEMLEAGFLKSYKKAMAILDLPMTEKSAPVILKTLEYFSNRHLGTNIQRVEQKSLNMNVSRSVGEAGETLDPEAMLERYEETKRLISTKAEVIDVSDEDIEKG